MPAKSETLVYQLKVTLRYSKPPIWRRLMVSESSTLYKLHQIIQIAMGWTDSHLHQFIIRGEYYGMTDVDFSFPVLNEQRYRLNQITSSAKFSFLYEYDFGDSWIHEIVVENILPSEPGVGYPVCVKGKLACPPEDVGGIGMYYGFLEAIRDPKNEQHDWYVKWLGDEFDPEQFDIDEVNRFLKRIR